MNHPTALSRSRAGLSLFALALILFMALVPSAGAAANSGATPALNAAPTSADSDTPNEGAPHPVVFIGTPGLSWSDVSPEDTPAIWELLDGSIGSLSVRSIRTVACPLDGWLALNAAERAAGPSSDCNVLVDPVNSEIPVWEDIEESVSEQNYSAPLGQLDTNLTQAGVSSVAIGPGAGVALANDSGWVANYEPRLTPGEGLARQVQHATSAHDLVVIDTGPIRPAPKGAYSTSEQFHADQVRIINNRVEAIKRGIDDSGREPTIIFASLADRSSPSARVFAITGGDWSGGVITSPSTRQPGYSLTTDLHATVLNELGVSGKYQGNPVRAEPSTLSLHERVEAERDRQRQSEVLQPPIIPTFFFTMVVVNVALYAAVAIGLKRPNMSRFNAWLHRRVGKVPPQVDGTWLPPRTNVLRVMRVVALSVASLPVASYVANFLPWWRTETPGLVLTLTIIGAIAVLVTIALAGPWRNTPLGPATVIAGILALILAGDVALGSPLQLGSVMGNPPVVAGRWYGMNNTAFAQFSTAMILLSIACAQPFVRRNHRVVAAIIITAFGVVTAFIDGAPFLGADFGGPPAILPAFFILALLAAGVRLTIKRVSLVFLATAAIVVAIAFIDWLRPADERSHIGNFFQQVLDGQLLIVVWRKLDANLRVLMGNRPLTILALSAVALVVFVLARPIRTEISEPRGGRYAWLSGGTPIKAMGQKAPLLGSALVGAALVAGLGMAANDSGIAIPANVAAVLVPSLIAATATWMLSLEPDELTQVPPPGSR